MQVSRAFNGNLHFLDKKILHCDLNLVLGFDDCSNDRSHLPHDLFDITIGSQATLFNKLTFSGYLPLIRGPDSNKVSRDKSEKSEFLTFCQEKSFGDLLSMIATKLWTTRDILNFAKVRFRDKLPTRQVQLFNPNLISRIFKVVKYIYTF